MCESGPLIASFDYGGGHTKSLILPLGNSPNSKDRSDSDAIHWERASGVYFMA